VFPLLGNGSSLEKTFVTGSQNERETDPNLNFDILKANEFNRI
jgi:hypothetical protein